MRVQTIVGVALVGGVTALSAQHGHQLEFTGFGTFTRFDPMWNLADRVGYGGRLGYFLNDYFGLEVGAGQTNAIPKTGGASTPVRPGDVSLLLNSGGQHNVLYVLAGWSRLSIGSVPPYAFGFDAAHGAIGDRIFLGYHLALRLEGGVYYDLSTQPGIPKPPLNYVGSAGLSILLGGRAPGRAETPEIPKAKRDSIVAAGGTIPTEKPSGKTFLAAGTSWLHQWFWGGQAGVMVFNTAYDGFSAEPTFGGHWLITAKKTALYVGYEQSFFLSARHATILEPNGVVEPGNVAFKSLRRIMMGVLAFPVQKALQPYGGGGFAIVEILNPVTTCSGCTLSDAISVQNAAESYGTKAFFWWMGGIDVRQGRLSLYGHYILTSSAKTFLIDGVTHTFQGGLRYSFGTSREDITETH